MATRTRRTERREEPLSRERIVEAAVGLLDSAGEGGLTFRALAEHLSTGPGAIYWHVTGKGELLDAATAAVLDAAMAAAAAGLGAAADPGAEAGPGEAADPGASTGPGEAAGGPAGVAAAPATVAGATPQEAIRALALGVFDAIDVHPWVGTQLSRAPGQSPMLRVLEHIGRQVQALGVPHAAQFTAASALLNYITGVAGQNAANARAHQARRPSPGRAEFLGAAADAWAALDPVEYPFTRGVADQLRDHDDRAEFLAGIDLVIAGITAVHPLPE
ncbi:TetR family transcriptional regulator [Streptomyces sp. NPDC059398]|uniref:TetR family transcriptional regulator n=1 Tax=Streptomyces sp. NPDC059398 TaxID=3346820 RepID=UPI0036BFF4B7